MGVGALVGVAGGFGGSFVPRMAGLLDYIMLLEFRIR